MNVLTYKRNTNEEIPREAISSFATIMKFGFEDNNVVKDLRKNLYETRTLKIDINSKETSYVCLQMIGCDMVFNIENSDFIYCMIGDLLTDVDIEYIISILPEMKKIPAGIFNECLPLYLKNVNAEFIVAHVKDVNVPLTLTIGVLPEEDILSERDTYSPREPDMFNRVIYSNTNFRSKSRYISGFKLPKNETEIEESLDCETKDVLSIMPPLSLQSKMFTSYHLSVGNGLPDGWYTEYNTPLVIKRVKINFTGSSYFILGRYIDFVYDIKNCDYIYISGNNDKDIPNSEEYINDLIRDIPETKTISPHVFTSYNPLLTVAIVYEMIIVHIKDISKPVYMTCGLMSGHTRKLTCIGTGKQYGDIYTSRVKYNNGLVSFYPTKTD